MDVGEIAGWVGLLSLPLFIAWDLARPRRRFAAPRGWRARAAVVTVASFWLSLVVGDLWGRFLGGSSLLDLSPLGTWAGAAVGILIYEFVHYAYHRAAHAWDWLWRAAHQMHHSAESIDALGAYYQHPLDTALFTTWASLVFYPLLGLSAEAGAVAAAFLSFNAAFQHANIRTPRWLGYLIQRPESHGIHHERDVHRYNYSDLPLWDIVFGTFRNPERWEAEAGFYPGASARVGAMMIGRDVSTPPSPSRAAAVAAVSTAA